jgi:hypothetical protein
VIKAIAEKLMGVELHSDRNSPRLTGSADVVAGKWLSSPTTAEYDFKERGRGL